MKQRKKLKCGFCGQYNDYSYVCHKCRCLFEGKKPVPKPKEVFIQCVLCRKTIKRRNLRHKYCNECSNDTIKQRKKLRTRLRYVLDKIDYYRLQDILGKPGMKELIKQHEKKYGDLLTKLHKVS